MKNTRLLFYISCFLVLCSISLIAANSGKEMLNAFDDTTPAVIANNSLVGTWNYTVSDVPYEYSSGVLYITQKDNKYSVKVKANYSTETGNNVKVNKNKLDFSVMLDGMEVKVALEVAADNTLKGKADSPEGVFAFVGKRSAK